MRIIIICLIRTNLIICLFSFGCYKKEQLVKAAEKPCDPNAYSEYWQVEYVEGYPVAYRNTCNGIVYMYKQKTGGFMSFKPTP